MLFRRVVLFSNVRRTLSSASNNVSAALVKQLRDKSGAPMLECKKALAAEEVNGDLQKALDWLRAKGKARAANFADRKASEGLIALHQDPNNKFLTLLEINSETDFVSRNAGFVTFVSSIAETASKSFGNGNINIEELMTKKSDSGITVQDGLTDFLTSFRENIVIRRAQKLDNSSSCENWFGYVHGRVGVETLPSNIQLGKTVSVVRLSSSEPLNESQSSAVDSIGRKLAMHVVAGSPSYLRVDVVPADVVERETSISMEQANSEGKAKTESVLAKVVAGKVQKRLGEICLLTQNHMAEEGSPIISKYLEKTSTDLKVKIGCTEFIKWTLGSDNA